MGACCSPVEFKPNDKDVIRILWPFNSSQAANLEQLKKLMPKANIELISNLKEHLVNLKSKKEEILNENEAFLICNKSDAENNAKIINEIPTIVKVFSLGEQDKTFIAKTGKKFYAPLILFRMILKSCLFELENLRTKREDRKYEENNKLKNPLSPTVNRDNPEVDESNVNNNQNTNSKRIDNEKEKEKPVILREEQHSIASIEQKTKLDELVCARDPTIKKESDTKSIKNTIVESTYNNAKLPISDSDSKALTFKNNYNHANPISNNRKSQINEIDEDFSEQEQKPVKDACIEFVFMEVLFNLFEKGKGCSVEAEEDFLQFCNEEGRNKKRNPDLDFNIADFLRLRKLIENADFDKENLAFDVYFGFPFVKQLCKKALQSSDFYRVFRLRFLLYYFFKALQDKTLAKEKDNIKNTNGNSKNSNANANNRYERYLDQGIKDDNISFKSKKVIYSKNELLQSYKVKNLFDAKGKVFLANDFTACCSKANLENLLFEAMENKNDKIDNVNNNYYNNNKDIVICSYFLNGNNDNNNDGNLNFESESRNKNENKIFKSIKKELENDLENANDYENETSLELQSRRNSVTNVEKLKLNIMQNDFQRVFCISDSTKTSGTSIDSAAGGKKSLANRAYKDENEMDCPTKDGFQFLIRNNIFLRITDIISKSHLVPAAASAANSNQNKNISELGNLRRTITPEESKAGGKTDNYNNQLESKNDSGEAQNSQRIEYFEVIFELQKHSDLPAEYKKTLSILTKKLSHILTLEYDNDYLYLFDILTYLDMSEKVIELIEDLLSNNPTPVEDELHSVEDKKFFMAQNLYYLGEAYAKTNQTTKAIKIHEESLQIKKEILREDHPEYVLSLNNLSSLYFNQEKYAQALDLYLECMQIEEKYLADKNNPNLGITYNNIATVHNKLNNLEDALKFYFKNYEIEKINYGENSLESAVTLNNIGIVYDNMGDFNMALRYYRDALKIREELSDEDDAELGNCYNNLAVALDNEGKLEEAVDHYQKSLNILRKHCDEDHPDVVTVLANIGVLQERIKNSKDNNNKNKRN